MGTYEQNESTTHTQEGKSDASKRLQIHYGLQMVGKQSQKKHTPCWAASVCSCLHAMRLLLKVGGYGQTRKSLENSYKPMKHELLQGQKCLNRATETTCIYTLDLWSSFSCVTT